MMWVRSFISHFKRILLFGMLAAAVTAGMNYLYVDDTDEFSRYMLHELYTQEENIDRLYIGSSHVFSDIDPLILDEVNGENNFNLATGTQQLITSYYLLREADRQHEIDHVYIDLYYDCMTEGLGNLHDHGSIPYSWIVLNQMKPSLNKLSYMLNLSRPRYYYLTFLAFTRYREQLFQPAYVYDIVRKKQTAVWKNYEYSHVRMREGEEFVMSSAPKGFMHNLATPEAGRFFERSSEPPLAEDPVTEESLAYFVKIMEYCRENDIALTWISCPISDFQLAGNGAYDHFVDQITRLAAQYGVPYYDFNLCRTEYLDLTSDRYWSDKGHLNSDGARVFTQFLGEFLQREEQSRNSCSDYFHGSYTEKLRAAKKDIFGLEITASDESAAYLPEAASDPGGEYAVCKVHPVTNAAEGEVEIHVCRLMEEETGDDHGRREYTQEEELPVVYDGNDGYVILDAQEHGCLYIEAKLISSPQTKNWARIEY